MSIHVFLIHKTKLVSMSIFVRAFYIVVLYILTIFFYNLFFCFLVAFLIKVLSLSFILLLASFGIIILK